MHDLEYAYVKVEPLEWTEELVAQLKREMDSGLSVLTSRKWVIKDGKGQWIECKPVEVQDATN